MNVNLSITVGNMIWCYDLDDHIKFEKIIDNIVINASNIYLKADSHDDVICTYKELDSNKPDVGNILYFSSKEKRDDYITNFIFTGMTSKRVIKALKECSKHKECAYCDLIYECNDKRQLCKLVLKVIKEYQDEIKRLKNKE